MKSCPPDRCLPGRRRRRRRRRRREDDSSRGSHAHRRDRARGTSLNWSTVSGERKNENQERERERERERNAGAAAVAAAAVAAVAAVVVAVVAVVVVVVVDGVSVAAAPPLIGAVYHSPWGTGEKEKKRNRKRKTHPRRKAKATWTIEKKKKKKKKKDVPKHTRDEMKDRKLPPPTPPPPPPPPPFNRSHWRIAKRIRNIRWRERRKKKAKKNDETNGQRCQARGTVSFSFPSAREERVEKKRESMEIDASRFDSEQQLLDGEIQFFVRVYVEWIQVQRITAISGHVYFPFSRIFFSFLGLFSFGEAIRWTAPTWTFFLFLSSGSMKR